jgi:hypothetical protein
VLRQDLVLKAALAGAISTILANLALNLINLFLPGPTITMPQLSAEFFLDIDNYTLMLQVIGFIWSMVFGAMYAFIYLLVLEKTGWNNLWLKSLFVISVIWLLPGGFVMRLMGIGQFLRGEPLSILAFYIAHLFFATFLSFLVSKLSNEVGS